VKNSLENICKVNQNNNYLFKFVSKIVSFMRWYGKMW